MSNINKAILIGRLGKDPELLQTQGGKQYAKFSMATSRKFKDEEKTTWHNVVCWNENTSKYLAAYAIKGTLVYVEGEIDNRSYEKDGQTRYTSEVVISAFSGNAQILVDGKGRGDAAKPQASVGYKEQSQGGLDAAQDFLDDDIPF